MPRRLLQVASCLLVPFTALSASDNPAQKPLQPQSRVWILRALTAEFAILKKALPRGQEGLTVNATGKVNEKALEMQLANFGPAARPGEMAQITKVNFLHSKIVLEMNGGGKKKRKWYQNIEVSGGVSVSQTGTPQESAATGGVIAMDFGGPVPDMTADELKERLADVLDFNQRSASLILTDTWPKEIQEAVKTHTITSGMTKEMVLASRGRPDNKIRERTKKGIDQETWVYGKVPAKVLLVTFENDEVVEAHEFIPGVAATRVPRIDDPPDTPPAPTKPPQ